ncbi:MAG: hypothetical protein ACLFVZ_08390, partial [Actinomycetota bacterium]
AVNFTVDLSVQIDQTLPEVGQAVSVLTGDAQFWQKNAVGYSKTPVGFSSAPVGYTRADPDDPSPF